MSSLSDQWFVGNSVCQHSAEPTANCFYFFFFFFRLVYFFFFLGFNELVVVCLLVDLCRSRWFLQGLCQRFHKAGWHILSLTLGSWGPYLPEL